MDEGRRVLQTGAGTKLSREQKAGFIFVIVCGMFALILGGQYLWTHMAAPFAITYTGPKFSTGSEQDAAKIAEQRQADTDFDTVNDYDELYIYKTSPYLEDSDSDGLTDGAEISSGQDPNCATGSACASVGNEDVIVSSDDPALDAQSAALATRQAELNQALTDLYTLPVSEIRSMLIESGADQAQVEAMTDEEVSAMYQAILTQLQQQGEIDKLIPPDLTSSTAP
jgi:hypothetical protein